ncbi:Lrp/AsnC family transcriptional regulator [Levilinea saccharolytica]|uniref:Transcriptional regulator, AsnC family n=1 Tax=Levilinea saccharolytica TaxID=229921 RepID=A0A0M8JQE8_9CHLR|nr:Lrp/AsnC family transcriptional regulator [Levilinea saccharolytica]KPL81840.1 hypothetical protein ADN01_09680 [Levilinea saccharolytica]GAP19432.1 transcriptional regulator, AsnC family [Levilinea saccharolytica]
MQRSPQIDEIDKRIADLLVENGELSCAEIAARLGTLTERAVRYRKERLVRQGFIRISAISSPRALGYTVTADVFIVVEPGQVLTVARHLSTYEQVTYVACSMGETDVSIQVVARSNEELHFFVTETIGKVTGVLRTTTMIVPLVIKNVYDWQIPQSNCRSEPIS